MDNQFSCADINFGGISRPDKTYTERTIEPIHTGLPKEVMSICPECKKVIQAVEFEEDGKVIMKKTCPEHGEFRDIIYSDAELFKQLETWPYIDKRGFKNPIVKNAKNCPDYCGLCDRHLSNTMLVNIDLTNRCNLRCPVCFANANVKGYVYEPSFEQVVEMLKTFRNQKPVPAQFVQFSGGEPTIYPEFLNVLRVSKELGYTHIQIATNGIKMANLEFAEKCKEAGLHTLYLQFDGINDNVSLSLRNRKLWEIKLKCVENVRKTDMKIVLVPTIVKGINDSQIGDIVRFAIDNEDIITGISFQPVAFTGRISREQREKQRFTLADLAHAVEEQTGFAKAREDWFPLSSISAFSAFGASILGREVLTVSCHPLCGLCTYFFIDKKTKKPVPITRFLNLKQLFIDLYKESEKLSSRKVKLFTMVRFLYYAKKYFNKEKAPAGLTPKLFLETLNGYIDKKYSRTKKYKKHNFPSFFVAGMHFQDSYNYDLDRIRRCVIHYGAPNGRIYPFCTYNSGPVYRDYIEKKFSKPLKKVVKKKEKVEPECVLPEF